MTPLQAFKTNLPEDDWTPEKGRARERSKRKPNIIPKPLGKVDYPRNARLKDVLKARVHAQGVAQGWLEMVEAECAVRPEKPANVFSDIETIKWAVCVVTGTTKAEFEGSRRTMDVVFARHIFFYLAKRRTPCSYPEIGGWAGGKDHTTVMYGSNKVKERIEAGDEKYTIAVQMVEDLF